MPDKNRIRKAFLTGYQSGRYWARRDAKLQPEYVRQSPYTTYAPGIQCHLAWKIGYHLAFHIQGKAEYRNWKEARNLYGI